MTVNFDHASIASLDWTKLRVVTHLRQFAAAPVDNINKALISLSFLDETVNSYSEHPDDLPMTVILHAANRS
jgi:hypothetical protein